MSTLIICEIGVNHGGSEDKAHQLIALAAKTGANAVKFQMFCPNELCGPGSQQRMLKALALPKEAFPRLEQTCINNGVDFLCAAFDPTSLDFLCANTDMKYIKIPSGEIINEQLLIAAASKNIPIILSTGMSSINEIGSALSIIRKVHNNITLLHCVSSYPAPIDQTNLRAMDDLQDVFNLPVGLSDHSLGINIPIAAVGMGATIIEKHFTDDVNAEGPDHKASLNPQDFTQMVNNIREIDLALGDGIKRCMPCEIPTRLKARRQIIDGKVTRRPS